MVRLPRQRHLDRALIAGTLLALVAIAVAVGVLVNRRARVELLLGGSDCIPHPEAFTAVSEYHHVLEPCGRWIDSDFVDRETQRELEFEVLTEINSLGFRNHDYPWEKPPGTVRVILVGDSFVYGFALPPERAFFRLLEAELTARHGRPVEVWNVAAVSWATLVQERLIRRQLLRASPDVLLLFFDLSDLVNNLAYDQLLLADGTFGPDPSMDDFWGLTKDSKRRWGEEKISRRALDLAALALASIADQAAAADVPLEVIFYPYPGSHQLEASSYRPLYRRLTELGVAHLSLFEAFDPSKDESHYFAANRHWNEAGSRLAADLVADHLSATHAEIFAHPATTLAPSMPQRSADPKPPPGFDLLDLNEPAGVEVTGLGPIATNGSARWRELGDGRATIELDGDADVDGGFSLRAVLNERAASIAIELGGNRRSLTPAKGSRVVVAELPLQMRAGANRISLELEAASAETTGESSGAQPRAPAARLFRLALHGVDDDRPTGRPVQVRMPSSPGAERATVGPNGNVILLVNDPRLNLLGCWDVEQAAGEGSPTAPFCWTQGFARLDILALPAERSFLLSLHLASAGGARSVRWLPRGGEARLLPIIETAAGHRILFDQPVRSDGSGTLTLELESSTFVPRQVDPTSTDTRRLGIALQRVVLRPLPE